MTPSDGTPTLAGAPIKTAFLARASLQYQRFLKATSAPAAKPRAISAGWTRGLFGSIGPMTPHASSMSSYHDSRLQFGSLNHVHPHALNTEHAFRYQANFEGQQFRLRP